MVWAPQTAAVHPWHHLRQNKSQLHVAYYFDRFGNFTPMNGATSKQPEAGWNHTEVIWIGISGGYQHSSFSNGPNESCPNSENLYSSRHEVRRGRLSRRYRSARRGN